MGTSGGFFAEIREPYSGGWQRGASVPDQRTILAFSAVYSCINLISSDVSKLRLKLMRQADDGVWSEVIQSPFLAPLRKPNSYQTRQQFISQWVTAKLLHGNCYVLKTRDARGLVTELFVLDPRTTTPAVTESGDVFYQISTDNLANVTEPIMVPASEIIHDRAVCAYHALVGVSPLYACASAASTGMKIQQNSQTFFANMSRPSGQLTAPGAISEDVARRLKTAFETEFGAGGLGRTLVAGDGLRWEGFAIPAADAQLVEQLRFSIEDVARCFAIPFYKLGGQPTTTYSNASIANNDYYVQCLQAHLEGIEALLAEGLSLPNGYAVEFDVDQLLRMDATARADALGKSVANGIMSPNEARAVEGLGPVRGGEVPFLQQQNWPISALADRPPPTTAGPQKLGVVSWKAHAIDGTVTEYTRKTTRSDAA